MYLDVFKNKVDYISGGANKLKNDVTNINEIKVETEISVLFNYLSVYSKVWSAALFTSSNIGFVHFRKSISQLGDLPKSKMLEKILSLVSEKLNLNGIDEYTAIYSLSKIRLIENRDVYSQFISLFIISIYYLLENQLSKLENLISRGVRSIIVEDFKSTNFKKAINLAYFSEYIYSYVDDLVNRIVDETEEFTGLEFNLFKLYSVALVIITILNELDDDILSLDLDDLLDNLFSRIMNKNWSLLKYAGSNLYFKVKEIFNFDKLKNYPELGQIIDKISDKEVSVDTALLFYFLLNENLRAELIKEEIFDNLTTKEFSTYFLKINLEDLFFNTLDELKIHLQNNLSKTSLQIFIQSKINTTLRTLISNTIAPIIEKSIKELLINIGLKIDTTIEKEIKELSFSLSMYFQSFDTEVPLSDDFESLIKDLYAKVFNFSETLLSNTVDKPVIENLIKEKTHTLRKRLGESKSNLISSLIKELVIESLVFTETTFFSHNVLATFIKNNLDLLLEKLSKVVEFSVLNLGVFNSFFVKNTSFVKDRNYVNKVVLSFSDIIAYYINYLESSLHQASEIITNAYFIDSLISLYNFYPKIFIYLIGQEYSFMLERFYKLNLEKALTKDLKLFEKGNSRKIELNNITEIILNNGKIETNGGEYLIKSNFSLPFLGAEIESLINVVSGFAVPNFENTNSIDLQIDFIREEIKELEEIYLITADISLEDYLKLFNKNFLLDAPYDIAFLEHLYFNILNSNQFKVKIIGAVEPMDILALSFLYDLGSMDLESINVNSRFGAKKVLENKEIINIYGIDVSALNSVIYNFDTLYDIRTKLKNHIYVEYKIKDWSLNSVIRSLLNVNPNLGAGKIINIPNQKYLIPRYKIPF